MPLRPTLLTALAAGDVAVLVAVHPPWRAVGRGVVRPADWLASTGTDTALAALCTVLLWAAAAWLALGLVVGLGLHLPGPTGRRCRRLAGVVLPRMLLRVVVGSTGLGVLAAPVAAVAGPPARADVRVASSAPAVPSPGWPVTPPVTPPAWPAGTPSSSTPSSGTPSSSTPPARTLPPPSLPTSTPPTSTPSTSTPSTSTPPARQGPTPGAPDRPHHHSQRDTSARVSAGDSLWLLAARRLGPHAHDADIARYWPRIYAANRGALGPDPSVIHPGQVLRLPAPPQESR